MAENEQQYLSERVEDQISWYEQSAQKNKYWYVSLKSIEIVAATLIPFLTGLIKDGDKWTKIIVGCLGVLIAIIAGILSTIKFDELWKQFRVTTEGLKRHKNLFITKSEPYVGENSFNLFVENIENLISKETADWIKLSSKNTDEQSKIDNLTRK